MLYIEKLDYKYKFIKINNTDILGSLIIRGILTEHKEFVSLTITRAEITLMIEKSLFKKYLPLFSSDGFVVLPASYSLLMVEWGPSETLQASITNHEIAPPKPALNIPGVIAEISMIFTEYGVSIFCTSSFTGNYIFVEETEAFKIFEEDVTSSDMGIYYQNNDNMNV